jgi:hypothetical protein
VLVSEFLLALIAVYTVWSQVAAQGHLDIMPWHWKLGLGMALSFAIVKVTAAAMDQEKAWNLATLRWFILVLVLAAACGLATYYYHLYAEPQGEEEEEDPSMTATSLTARVVRPPSAWRASR